MQVPIAATRRVRAPLITLALRTLQTADMSQLATYSLPLSAGSSMWMYAPARDALAPQGWNASYTGSTAWPPSGASDTGSGAFNFRTQNGNATVSLSFSGTGALLCLRGNGAHYGLQVDGKQIAIQTQDNDAACLEFGAETTISTGQFPFAAHNVILSVAASAAHEFQFYGGVASTSIAVDSSDEKPTEFVIDDQDPGWLLQRGSGVWDIASAANTIDGSITFKCPYGDGGHAEYSFIGASALVFYGRPSRDTHDFSVLLTGGTVFNSDASVSGWALGSTVAFFQAGLNPSQVYTLTFRNYNADKPKCISDPVGRYCCAAFDGLKLIGSAKSLAHFLPLPSSSVTSTSSTQGSSTQGATGTQAQVSATSPSGNASSKNVGAIVGGALGGVAVAILIAVAAIWFFWRRRSPRQQGPPPSALDLPNADLMYGSPYSPSQMSSNVAAAASFWQTGADRTLSPFGFGAPSSHPPTVMTTSSDAAPSPVTVMSGPPMMVGKRQHSQSTADRARHGAVSPATTSSTPERVLPTTGGQNFTQPPSYYQ
ncbi:hypothetical protein BKA62DRAFT_49396 [Auriculariales sp. MPI-PUGE-AT-0066]|nr:hypothetical protein BKA62DRAFT_49396 [Auriculariales sp. MPI-PUGE-AT-0066]